MNDEAQLVSALWTSVGDWFGTGADRDAIAAIGERYASPDVVYVEDPSWPDAGTYRGRDAFIDRFLEYAEMLQINSVQPGRIEAGRRGVVAELTISMLGADAGQPIEFLWTYTLQVEDGRVTHVRAWVDGDAARRSVS